MIGDVIKRSGDPTDKLSPPPDFIGFSPFITLTVIINNDPYNLIDAMSPVLYTLSE